jgi:hypothetical protein
VKLGEHGLKELLDGLNTPADYLAAGGYWGTFIFLNLVAPQGNQLQWNEVLPYYTITLFLAKSPETVDKLEGLVALWAKEIELVLAKSEQVLIIMWNIERGFCLLWL